MLVINYVLVFFPQDSSKDGTRFPPQSNNNDHYIHSFLIVADSPWFQLRCPLTLHVWIPNSGWTWAWAYLSTCSSWVDMLFSPFATKTAVSGCIHYMHMSYVCISYTVSILQSIFRGCAIFKRAALKASIPWFMPVLQLGSRILIGGIRCLWNCCPFLARTSLVCWLTILQESP